MLANNATFLFEKLKNIENTVEKLNQGMIPFCRATP
jgi:hypothetical protein